MYTHNELVIPQPADALWTPLVRASRWSTWYFNARAVRIEGGAAELGPGTRFRWVTFGMPLRSEVRVCDPPARIGWTWSTLGAHGYHGWLLEPAPGGGTRVVTEETQRGPLAALIRYPMRAALSAAHQHWLRQLATVPERDGGAGR